MPTLTSYVLPIGWRVGYMVIYINLLFARHGSTGTRKNKTKKKQVKT